MSVEEFNNTYPEGMNKEVQRFERALYEIMTSKEIDNIIHFANLIERQKLKRFKKFYKECVNKWYDIPFVILLQLVDSPELLKDIIMYMTTIKDEDLY